MKKLNKLVLTISAITTLLLYSCDKETDNITTPDTDAFRILKVEVLEPYYPYFPFYNNLALVEYNYDNEGKLSSIDIWCNKSKVNCMQNNEIHIPNYSGFKIEVSKEADKISVKLLANGFYWPGLGEFLLPNKIFTSESGNNKKINSSFVVVNGYSPPIEGLVQLSTKHIYDSNDKLSGFRTVYKNTNETEPDLEIRNVDILSQDAGLVSKVSWWDSYIYNDWFFQETTSSYEFVDDDEIPSQLKGLVNISLQKMSPFGFEENLSHWITSKKSPISMNSSFSDWVLLFGIPELSMLQIDQNEIVSKVSTIGRKLVSVNLDSPGSEVYEDINENKTFPYKHDPVNKTLEINGIRIYYQSPDN
jgi:hypothetical protein